jgi:hypothetical protein
MKSAILLLAFVCLLGLTGPAKALICTIDDVPAATLLLPYFEVDLDDPNGATTLFSVNNASATAVLAHVVIWSDASVPVLDFNLYLTGYDVQSINLRDILNGNVPQTASAGQDPGDLLSPKGPLSQDVDFASCQDQFPIGPLPADFVAYLQAALTGQSTDLLGGCAGLRHGDNVARGYVTVDTVNNCTLRFPGDLGYFGAGGTGDATNENVLWGDYFYVNPQTNRADGETLVHIEASATNPATSTPGQYTFYGRYVDWTAVDNREPLPTTFAVRFLTGGPFDGGTHLIVWRDSKLQQGAFGCFWGPDYYPLGTEQIVIFDEQEHSQVPETIPVSPQPPEEGITPFPVEAQSVAVGGDSFPVPYKFGWLFLDLNTAVDQVFDVPPADPAAAQAWVQAVMSGLGRYSVGFDAIQLDSACAARHQPIGVTP